MDQPSIDGINTWFVSKAAHEAGLKVAVSGLGGDELFGGYPSFRHVPRLAAWLAPWRHARGAASWSRRLAEPLIRRTPFSPKLAGLLEYGGSFAGAYLLRRGLFMPWELARVLPDDEAAEGLERLAPLSLIGAALRPTPAAPFARVATLEASLYMRNQLLRDTDWASMAHSLEVRTPLVDAELLRRLAPIICGRRSVSGKQLLGRSPSPALPREVLQRPKSGFGVPLASWLERAQAAGGPLDEWRRNRSLSHPRCHWARRLAYSLLASWS
jgi:asparagine synthase (glutamine-hydrolysing)